MLAFGGDLRLERLLLAYREGIFPWYEPGEPIVWWSPNPRFVMHPGEVVIQKSMRPVLRRHFRITFDRAFQEVIAACRKTLRKGQEDTWITDEMQAAYIGLHQAGYAHSVEVWHGDQMVGGLYGVAMGRAFFGESMFSKQSNASKAGFIQLCRTLEAQRFSLIDCQVHSDHLERLGAYHIPRKQFMEELHQALEAPAPPHCWREWEGCHWFH